WSKKTVNHEELLTEIKIEDVKLNERDFVRIEITPKDQDQITRNPDDWIFNVDEERTLPDWYEMNIIKCQKACWKAWEESILVNLVMGEEEIKVSDDRFLFANGKAKIVASDSVSIKAYGSVSIVAYDSVSIVAYDSVSIVASDSVSIEAYDSVSIEAYDSVSIEAYDSVSIKAYDSVSIEAYGSVSIVAYGSVSIVAYGSVSIEASDSVSIKAYDSVSIKAYDYWKGKAFLNSVTASLVWKQKIYVKTEAVIVKTDEVKTET
ncbi:MAG: hypothetical protein MUP17_09570, partial [candidate division Zixibacteria bacterium]|nr:hypothetical protein [candidate division Zixibacteria bacterium]